jgi:nucleoside-diphosphate-sugar epimerase
MLLITGATGHSGEWFIKMLIAEKYDKKIRCSVRETSNFSLLKSSGLNIEIMVGNLKDPSFVNELLDEVSIVINFTGLKCVNNLVNSENFKFIQWIISIHTTAIFSKYKLLSKEYQEIESRLINSGIDYSIARPTMIYGSQKDRNISKLITYFQKYSFFPIFGKGENLIQPIYAKDVATAIYSIFKNKAFVVNKSYNIAGKYPITYNELLRMVAKALNRNITFIHIPYNISYILIRLLNSLISKFPISTEQIMRMNEDKVYDYTEAFKDFGFSPISFRHGIDLEILEYKQRNL